MNNRELIQLRAFVTVSGSRSFAKAEEILGTSRPAISRIIAELEERIGQRLLNRTTRSVAPTEAGARLLAQAAPALDVLESAFADANTVPGELAGRLRLNAGSLAARELLAPLLPVFLKRYPAVSVEVVSEDRLVDMVGAGFDAGVRLGEVVERDMIAVPIGPKLRMRIVAAPTYLATARPLLHPSDLACHPCLNLRAPTSGQPYRWELQSSDKRLEIEVTGPVVADDAVIVVAAAVAGLGVAYLFETDIVAPLASGSLVTILDDWTPAFAGYHIYFPSRRGISPVLRAFLDFVREDALQG